MNAKTRVFDVKKLARSLDRIEGSPVVSEGEMRESALSELNDYLLEFLAVPMLTKSVIPLNKLDLERISNEDIENLHDAFDRIGDTELRGFSLCTAFTSLSAVAASKKLII